MENVYKAHGYANRKEYLKSLADDYGVSYQTVATIASMLGETEDFDGLVSSLQDIEDGCFDL